MPHIVLDRDLCPCCKVHLIKLQTVIKPDSEYDSCVCPECQIHFSTNWHPIGEPEPERLTAAEAA
jgi:hypothetical protein